jgi:hypothetical protein
VVDHPGDAPRRGEPGPRNGDGVYRSRVAGNKPVQRLGRAHRKPTPDGEGVERPFEPGIIGHFSGDHVAVDDCDIRVGAADIDACKHHSSTILERSI